MSQGAIMNREYEQPKIPSSWGADEKRFAIGVINVLDDIYLKYGRLGLQDLSNVLRTEIVETDERSVANSAELDVQAEQIQARVTKTEFDAEKVIRSTTAPTSPVEGTLWLNTSTNVLKRYDGSAWVTTTAEKVETSGISISADEVTLESTGKISAVISGEEKLLIDQNGVSADYGAFDDIGCPTIVKCGSGAEWKGTIQASLDALPKMILTDTTLTVPAGTYNETVTITGFQGAKLNIVFSDGAILMGRVVIKGCQFLNITGDIDEECVICASTSTQTETVWISNSNVYISGIHISGYRSRTGADDGTARGVYITQSTLRMDSCCVEYTNEYAVFVNRAVMGAFHNCIGGQSTQSYANNSNYGQGIRIVASTVFLIGTTPKAGSGGTSLYYATYGGQVLFDTAPTGTNGTWSSGGGTEMTTSFNCSGHINYCYDHRSTAGYIYQGIYKTWQRGISPNIGTFWFTDAENLTGKTIISATLRMKRGNSGSSSNRNVYLGYVPLSYAQRETTNYPSFAHTDSQPAYPAGSVYLEREITIDVTNLMPYIVQGYGLGLKEDISSSYEGNYSPHYTYFYGSGSTYKPVLTVTYRDD